MGGIVNAIFGGGGGNGQSQRGSALASLLSREAEVNKQIGADGGARRRRGRQLLEVLNDAPEALN